MTRLSRSDLDRMLEAAQGSRTVTYPGGTFCDLITMALEAALEQKSPAFTLRELETLLFDCTGQDLVNFDSTEFVTLVRLAMQVAKP